jgi:betaine-aldehyde dehydrogenase/5-carboxymethyl-2-hydroxymuconic-semialdehyde dehydrogenase
MLDIDGLRVSGDHYIGGQRVTSDSSFEVRTPLDWNRKLGEVARGTAATAVEAVSAAASAFRGWAELGAAGRAVYLNRLADAIEARASDIALVECLDAGLLHESLKLRLVPRGARNFRSYAQLASEYVERAWSSNGTSNRVIRMSAGPTVIITPWNAPFMLATWKVAPALAAGNTVILKPAEWSPLSASLLADLAEAAGFPPGVLNVVQGIGEEVGAPLVRDPRVRRISFTGSPETARHIGRAAAENIVPFTAELGGKGPLLVFADCDIDAAAKKAAGQYDDSGQVCLAGTRLLVEATVREPFLERFHRYTDAQVLGDSRDPRTTMAPLIHPRHLERVADFVERARQAGDRVLRGGRIYREGSLWYEPTLIEPVDNDAEIVQREVFGPVLTLQTFPNEATAIQLANSTRYGLSGILYTGNAERAERVGRALRAGVVWANCFLIRDLTAPFGGIGYSGIGREGGDYALDFHSDLKSLQILDGSVH